jgi:hypothetical protein
MVSDIHRAIVKGQEGSDSKKLPVSDTPTVTTTEYMLISAQTQTRSASSATDQSSILYLYLAHLVNYLLRPQEPVSVVTS